MTGVLARKCNNSICSAFINTAHLVDLVQLVHRVTLIDTETLITFSPAGGSDSRLNSEVGVDDEFNNERTLLQSTYWPKIGMVSGVVTRSPDLCK